MPVSAPFIVMSKLQLLFPNKGDRFIISAENAANEAEMIVFTTDRLTAAPSPSAEMLVWEPPLKARNPKNKINPPKAAI